MGRVTSNNSQPTQDMIEGAKSTQSDSSAPSGRLHPLVGPCETGYYWRSLHVLPEWRLTLVTTHGDGRLIAYDLEDAHYSVPKHWCAIEDFGPCDWIHIHRPNVPDQATASTR